MTTSLVMTSPVDDFISSVAAASCGNELSIVNGMRSGLPATAKVGTSKLESSTSGRCDSAPVGTVKTGTSRMRSFVAAWLGGSPTFQSPSLIERDCAQMRILLRSCGQRAADVGAVLRRIGVGGERLDRDIELWR
jgi:hypothetical protein